AFRLQIPIPAKPAPSSINEAGSATVVVPGGTSADNRLPVFPVTSPVPVFVVPFVVKSTFRWGSVKSNVPPVLLMVSGPKVNGRAELNAVGAVFLMKQAPFGTLPFWQPLLLS